LKIFDTLGKEVATIASEEMPAGNYTRIWDAAGFPSGIYFYRLSVEPSVRRDLELNNGQNGQVGSFSQTKKVVLLK
jgi:hypothetical protein